jgi:predicted nucleic-acid-binding protein
MKFKQIRFVHKINNTKIKTMKYITNTCLLFSVILLTASCKKERKIIKEGPDTFFAYSNEGLTVHFENKTVGGASYKWDFGDGATAIDISPTHTYLTKGKYVPTLYATDADGKVSDASTVLFLSKPSSVKLNDHSFTDWDTIQVNKVLPGVDGGNFIVSKYDYDGNNIYFYFEQHASFSDHLIYDLYIDADNNNTTGYLTGEVPGGAYDLLLEGSILNNWLDVYYHNGNQASFGGYTLQSIADFYTIGHTDESGGVIRFEGAIKRSKLRNLTGQGLKIGVQCVKNDWSEFVGWSPDIHTNAFFMDLSQ